MTGARVDSPRISVIVVNWNQAEFLRACIRSLSHDHVRSIAEVIVVDNGSTDSSVATMRSEFPWVEVIESKKNLGFTGGNELGLRHSKGEIVFLLNNDAEIEVDCLDHVLAAFDRDPSVALVGCVVKDLRDRRRILERGQAIDRFAFPIPYEAKREGPPFYVSGCALGIRRQVIDQLGFLDDRFFMFVEDVDLCWRYRLAGNKLVIADEATVYHEGGGSLTGGTARGSVYVTSLWRIYLRERNTVATLIKNYSAPSLLLILPAYIAVLFGEFLTALILFRFQLAMQYVRSVTWNLRNLRETLQMRRFVQSNRVVRDRDLPFDRRFGKLLALRLVRMPRLVK